MRMPIYSLLPLAGLAVLLASCSPSAANVDNPRANILVAGSSTVFPFTRAVADKWQAAHKELPAPVVQSTGTGAGIEAFCAGMGKDSPDLVDASRRMTAAEMQRCRENGVNVITELQIGADGLVVAQSPAAPPITLTRIALYEALAAAPYGQANTRRSWKDVDPSLPDIPILVYGPPASSGTRDSLKELIMIGGCQTDASMRALRDQDPAGYERLCTEIRGDGAYVEQGEDDKRIATMLVVNPGAIGIFGYSFLKAQQGKLRAISIDGIEPDEETIASARYPGARPLYVYVKAVNVENVPGLRDFLDEYVGAIGPGGYLAKGGLVPAPERVRIETAEAAARLKPVNAAALR